MNCGMSETQTVSYTHLDVYKRQGPLRVRDASGHEEKMSKSLGNFWTIRDALKDTEAAYGEGNGAEVLRFFLLRLSLIHI